MTAERCSTPFVTIMSLRRALNTRHLPASHIPSLRLPDYLPGELSVEELLKENR